MILIRWFAIIPACILTWHAVVIFGLFLLPIIGWFCPPDEIVSGSCTAWWYPHAVQLLIVSCAGLSAFLVVICATVIAPALRVLVSWIAYISGMCVALVMWISQPDATSEFRAAAVGGLIAVCLTTKILGIRDLPILFEEPQQGVE